MRPLWLLVPLSLAGCTTVDVLGSRDQQQDPDDPPATDPGELPNVLEERQNVPISQVNARLNDAYLQLFFGDLASEAVFFDVGDGTGYVEDIANGDVRTDSMGYGMLVSAQLNQREVFDKLWSWVKAHMLFESGPALGMLSWNCDTSGQTCATDAATDASTVIAASLLIAHSRFSNLGAHDYLGDARSLLAAMTTAEERNQGVIDGVVNCFNVERALPRAGSRSPEEQAPIDYFMPAFYDLFAKNDPERSELWSQMADNSRALLSRAAHPTTALLPEVIDYEGTPVPGRDDYLSTTHRALLNVTLDHMWSGPLPWAVDQNERRLDFFLSQGVDTYVAEYTTVGTPLVTFNTAAHRSLVALTAGTTPDAAYDVFLEKLLAEEIPTGDFRYYDGMLYILSLLALSGQMTPG